MYKFYWTNSEEDFRLWDEFLSSTKRGHYSQLSHWLKSYSNYGFMIDLLIVKNDKGELIGGAGMVISKILFFKFCSCACGPIIKEGHEEIFNEVVEKIKAQAKKYRPICSSINFPILAQENKNIAPFCINTELDKATINGSYKGNMVKSVTSINGFREVKIDYSSEVSPEEALFKQFSNNTKRNVKKALKNNLSLHFAKTEDEINEAYKLIELNGKNRGYSVRSWEDFKETLINMIKSGSCIIPVCKHNDELKGALIVFHTGKRFTYISGGTLREETDLKVGHFLHFQMLKISIEKRYNFYDISVGGSLGVTRFKEGFGGRHVKFIGERYWIHNKPLFWFYNKLLPSLKRHKKFISKILKFLK
ncbi:lipid II:glycine glycyltransferase FemX [Flavivirga eckloniae]|uniref:BioF2-like acetyltransferase domain-containing protein n=1 Tax=Flavivirga eckloniae TaxID=1803846 RepID=A0A2K9PR81_9FLAO|nr:peptidoglycan bridge formation glycyltransferase FemA/FemB family protein [Flavivirga eckloniae]AUP79545.1 hypothetical protein C1H87_12835 [Flavivirga eckloniae]